MLMIPLEAPKVTNAAFLVLVQIDIYLEEFGAFPAPSDLNKDKPTMRGSTIRSYKALEEAGYIERASKSWETGRITEAGIAALAEVEPVAVTSKIRLVVDGRGISLAGSVHEILCLIEQWIEEHGSFPDTSDITRKLTGALRSFDRAHTITHFKRLETLGIIERSGYRWRDGHLTIFGARVLARLPRAAGLGQPRRRRRYGGGVHADGGTKHKDMLFAASDPRCEMVQASYTGTKLGLRVEKNTGRHFGLQIATISLEEGRTCSPNCDIRKHCYVGKMSLQKRILYQGELTDRRVAQAICEREQSHYRLPNTGDFPTHSFLEATLSAIAVTGSTAFGYTHWQPENELGAKIRYLSGIHWNFFAIRTSYTHGCREPILEQAAVTLPRYDVDLLRMHNAFPCLEEIGKVADCGKCGACWHPKLRKKNVAFFFH